MIALERFIDFDHRFLFQMVLPIERHNNHNIVGGLEKCHRGAERLKEERLIIWKFYLFANLLNHVSLLSHSLGKTRVSVF